jgi:hypothetical protein
MTAPVTGGAPVTIDMDLGNSSASVASDGSYLYWTDTHGLVGELRRTPLPYVPGAQPQALMSSLDGVNPGIALDSTYAYIMEANGDLGNVVYRVKKDGSTSDSLGIALIDDVNGQHKGLQLTGVDASFVYFLLFDGLVARLPLTP